MSATYTGRAMSPVADQMDLIKPHVTRATNNSPRRHTDQHTFILGKPPEWTALGRCVGNYMLYDDSVGLRAGEAAARCAGCPVIEQCLADAMAQEGTLSAGSRYGIRGALSPKERASLAGEKRAAAKREKYQAEKMNPEFMARRAAELRDSRSVQMVSCLDCRSEMRVSSFPRHLAVKHGEERVA